ncbi:TolC family protein [Burkholderia sp. 22PA0106]|uniref:TolC family protein n=1 Tax=Burkholderia sp. 22PA0106 TaxID=3237371 RepID=UPI0039C18A51
MKRAIHWMLAGAAATALSACIDLSPTYQRPPAPVAAAWPDAASASAAQAPDVQAADIGWRTFFVDARLQNTIALTLSNNRDLRIAILNIEKERAEYRIQRASLFPEIDLGGNEDAERTPTSVRSAQTGSASATNSQSGEISHVYSANLGFTSYELDLFGRVRNLSKAALETYLSTVETRRSTQISLVSEVASDWLTLASDRRLLAIAQATLASQQRTFDLVSREHALGAASALDLAQAQASLQAARNSAAQAQTTAEQARNALDLVAGTRVPDADLPDAQLDPVASITAIPAGIPSAVLQRRPDVLAA